MPPHKPLIFFVDPAWRGAGSRHTPLMYPFWGNPPTEDSFILKELFDTYSFDTRFYSITDLIDEADMVFMPYRYNVLLLENPSLINTCVTVAKKANLPLLIDASGDIEHRIDIPNAYFLRIGGYRFMQHKNEIHFPPYADDLLERLEKGKIQMREKKTSEKPIVGFAGWAKLSSKQYIRTFVKEIPLRLRALLDERYRACLKGVWWRKRALAVLGNSPEVTSNFLIRSSFSGSAKTADKDLHTLRQEFVHNLLESDYGLCIRGDANASVRLFETMALGRIPVILDTECNFPFSDKIDYTSFALIVDFRDIKKLPELIAEFHKNISPERFEQMQKNAREAYINYFRVDALIRPIVEELRAKLSLSEPI